MALFKKVPAWAIFPAMMLVAAVVLGLGRVSGSSVGMYNFAFFGYDYKDPAVLSGVPRAVRTDEWLVQTQWTLAQARAAFALENPLYAASQTLALSNVPVAHWSMFFKPWLWLFFVLDIETAFSLSWWLRAATLLAAVYFFLLRLTRGDVPVAVLGALSFFFSPFIQWWYSTGLVDISAFAFLVFLCFANILESRSRASAAAHALLFAYCALVFALVLYPPSQIPVVLLFIFAGVGYLLGPGRPVGWGAARRGALALGVGLALVAVAGIVFYADFRDVITTVQGSAYPGQRRIETGGGFSLARLAAGFYDKGLQRTVVPPSMGENQSEAAGFFHFSLFLLPVYGVLAARMAFKKQDPDPFFLAILAVYLLLLVWMTVGLPPFVARLFLLQFAPPARAWLALGMADLLLVFSFIYCIRIQQSNRLQALWLAWAALSALALAGVGLQLFAEEPRFFNGLPDLGLVVFVVFILFLLLLLQRGREFGAVLLLFSLLAALLVNPLYVGLSPVLDSDLAQAVRTAQTRSPGATWVVYEHPGFANYLAANGARVFNGVYSTPDVDFWRQFDPQGRHEDVYNRFAHVLVHDPGSDQVDFLLVQPDRFQLNIAPCHPLLADLGVDLFLFTEPVEHACLALSQTVTYPEMQFYIYERK